MAFLSRCLSATDLSRRRWYPLRGLLGLLGIIGCNAGLLAQTAPPAEYQVKAVFLFNLVQFVQWPSKAFPDPGSPLVIGLLGEDPFGGYLDETLRGEKVNNRPLVLQRYRRVSDARNCYMLFISRSENTSLEQIFGAVRGRSILTVGDSDDFIARGGMIRLVTERNKIRIRINIEAVRAAGLTISSKLLRLAEPES